MKGLLVDAKSLVHGTMYGVMILKDRAAMRNVSSYNIG